MCHKFLFMFIYNQSCVSVCVNQSVQAVFRSLASMEKTVEKCHIELDKQKDRLTFILHCKHGISASLPSSDNSHTALFSRIIRGLCLINTNPLYLVAANHAFMTLYPVSECFHVGIVSAGLLKTHNLSFQDSESLQAVFDKDNCANVFRAQPRCVSCSALVIVKILLLH